MADALDERQRRLFEAAAREEGPADLHSRLLDRARERRRSEAGPHAGLAGLRRPPGERRRSLRSARAYARSVRWVLFAAALGGLLVARAAFKPEAPRIAPEARMPGASSRSASSTPLGSIVRSTGAGATGADASGAAPSAPVSAARSPADAERHGTPRGPSTSAEPGGTRSKSAAMAEQVESLMQARALVRSGDGVGALRVLDGAARHWGAADLGEEATVLRIEALAAAGRSSESRTLARRFVERHPNSALADRARSFADAPPTAGTAP